MARVRKAIIPETLDAALAALLTGIREAAGITQVELARRLDQPQSLVAKIETCTRRISAVELLLVCRALGCDPGRVLADLDAAAPGRGQHRVSAVGGAAGLRRPRRVDGKTDHDQGGTAGDIRNAGERRRTVRPKA